MAGPHHRPVMLAEVLKVLQPQGNGLYVDGTLGAGGHAAAILEHAGLKARLLGLDRDPRALELAADRLKSFSSRVKLVQNTFDEMGAELAAWGQGLPQGILLDLGVSSMQLDEAHRGFAFRQDAPLDMGMGRNQSSAADLVATLSQKDLARLFRQLGEEPLAARLARAIVGARKKKPITTTGQLAALIEEAMPAKERHQRKTHPATKVFQALRMAVNDELGQLERFLESFPRWLAPGGRLAILSYHSLEDRRVKQALRALAEPCTCPPELPVCACGKKPLVSLESKKALKPSPAEVEANPRARSARLRWAIRTGEAAS